MSLIAKAHANKSLLPGHPFNRDVVARAGPTLRHRLPTVELIDDLENSLENCRIVNLANGRSNAQVRMADSNRCRTLRRFERESWLAVAPSHRQGAQGEGDHTAARSWHQRHERSE